MHDPLEDQMNPSWIHQGCLPGWRRDLEEIAQIAEDLKTRIEAGEEIGFGKMFDTLTHLPMPRPRSDPSPAIPYPDWDQSALRAVRAARARGDFPEASDQEILQKYYFRKSENDHQRFIDFALGRLRLLIDLTLDLGLYLRGVPPAFRVSLLGRLAKEARLLAGTYEPKIPESHGD